MSSPGTEAPPPEAPGARYYREMLATGAPADQVNQWRTSMYTKMLQSGAPADQVNAYWGASPPDTKAADTHAASTLGALPPDKQAKVADNPLEMLEAGWQTSNLGLYVRGKVPDVIAPEHTDLWNSILTGAGQMVGDTPAMILGYSLGTAGGAAAGGAAGAAVPGAGETGGSEVIGAAVGGTLGGGAVSAALPQAIREAQMAAYSSGHATTFKDFFADTTAALMRVLKTGAVGAAMGPADKLTGGLASKLGAGRVVSTGAGMAAAAATGTAVGGALDGKVPDWKDFVTAGVLMLGAHAGQVVAGKFNASDAGNRVQTNLKRIYAERGIPPWEAVARAATDPVWRQEIMGQDPSGKPTHPAITRESPREPEPYHKPEPSTPISETMAENFIRQAVPGAVWGPKSGFRDADMNASVHGASNSMHLKGMAHDFVPPGPHWTQVELNEFAAKLDAAGLPHTELMVEYADTAHSTGYHVHWGWGEKGAVSHGRATAPDAASMLPLLRREGDNGFVADTRGQGVQYHGSRGPVPPLREGYYNDKNIYGAYNFYTTDAQDIAMGYGRKNPNSTLNQVTEKEPVNFFNMEDRQAPDDWHKQLPIKSDLFNDAVEEAANQNGGKPNLREIMDEMRGLSRDHMMSRDSVQEEFDSIHSLLAEKGFGGASHTGGLKTNNPPHTVKMYYRPHEQIAVEPVKPTRVSSYHVPHGTARAYGFRPETVAADPSTAEDAARTALEDLHHRYNGDVDDTLVAYDAGQDFANKWIAGGRQPEELPPQTQRFLENAGREPNGLAGRVWSRDWKNFPRDTTVAKQGPNGVAVPAPDAISSYLQDFGRLAGFRFMVGQPETTSALESDDPYGHPHYAPEAKSVFIPDTPDELNRRWYGLGRYEILYHEIGHALDHTQLRSDKMEPVPEGSPLHAEMLEASREFRPKLWEANPAYNSKPEELMADAIAAWLSNPVRRRQMPLFTSNYGKLLTPYLKIAEQALPVRNAKGDWTNPQAPPGGAAGGGGSVPPPPGGQPPAPPGGPLPAPGVPPVQPNAATLEDKMLDIIGKRAAPPSVFNLKKLYRQWISELGPARDVDKLLEAEGLHHPASDAMNTEDMFRQTYASQQRADYFVRYGTLSPSGVDNAGRGFVEPTSDQNFMAAYDLAQKNGGTVKGFTAYRIAARVVELAGRGIKIDKIKVNEAAQVVADGAKKYTDAARMMNDVKNAALDYAKESGIFNEDRVRAMKDLNQAHIRFAAITGEEQPSMSSRGRGFKPGDPLRRIQGGDYLIEDPVIADIENLHMLIKMADRNRAIGHIVGAEEAHQALQIAQVPGGPTIAAPGSNVFKPILTAAQQAALEPMLAVRANRNSLKANQFIYFRDGQPELWEAKDPALAQLMRGADRVPEANAISRLATAFARIQRAGIVMAPDYSTRITMRHQVTAAIFDPHGGIPFKDFFTGIGHVLKLDDTFKRMQANGAFGTALVTMDQDYIQRDIAAILDKTGAAEKLWNTVRHPIQFAQLISERMDAAGRIGYALRNEAELGTLKATTSSRKAQLDYVERGTSAIAQFLAQITPFQRAHLIGMKQQYEGWHENFAATALKHAAYVVAPAAALYFLNWYQDKHGDLPLNQQYNQLPRWERDTQFIAPSIYGVRPRLMMPPGTGLMMGGITNRLLDHFVEHDPHAFDDWGKSLIASFFPPFLPTVVEPMVEAATNHNFFSGHTLIPTSLEHASGPEQYTENTTAVARKLGHYIGMTPLKDTGADSPIVIENFARQWSGTIGLAALRTLNAPIGATSQRPWALTDIPFVQSFLITNPGASAYAINNFYEDMGKLQTAHADLHLAIVRASESGDMSEIPAKAADPRAAISLANIARAMKLQREAVIAINDNKTMNDDEKRQFTSALYDRMISEAELGSKVVGSIK